MEQTVTLAAEEWAIVRESMKVSAKALIDNGQREPAFTLMGLFYKVAKQTNYDD